MLPCFREIRSGSGLTHGMESIGRGRLAATLLLLLVTLSCRILWGSFEGTESANGALSGLYEWPSFEIQDLSVDDRRQAGLASPKGDDPIHVAMVFDSNRWDHGLAVLRALAVHEDDTVFVHLVVPEERSQDILNETESWGVPIIVQLYPHSLCAQHAEELRPQTTPQLHVSALCKMHLADILPQVSRVIYLDNDVIPVQSVARCWRALRNFSSRQVIGMAVDMGRVCQLYPELCWPVAYDWTIPNGLVCGDEPEILAEQKISASSRWRRSSTGGNNSDVRGPMCPRAGERELYQFNGGVLLMDLDKMRAFGFVSKYVQHTQATFEALGRRPALWGEQCFINSFFTKYDVLYQLPCGCNYQWTGSRRRSKCSSQQVYIGHGWQGGISGKQKSERANRFHSYYAMFKDQLRGDCVRHTRNLVKSGARRHPSCPVVDSFSLRTLSDKTVASGATLKEPQLTPHCPHQRLPCCRPATRSFLTDTVNIITPTTGRHLLFADLRASFAAQQYPGTLRHVIGTDLASFEKIVDYEDLDMHHVFVERPHAEALGQRRNQSSQHSTGPADTATREPCDHVDKSGGDVPSPVVRRRRALQRSVLDGWIVHVDEDHIFQGTDAIAAMMSVVQTEDDLVVWKTRAGKATTPSPGRFFARLARNDISPSSFLFHSKHANLTAWVGSESCSTFRTVYSLAQFLAVRWVNRVLLLKNPTALVQAADSSSKLAEESASMVMPTVERVTVVMMGYAPSRRERLVAAVTLYCGSVYSGVVAGLILVWNNPDEPVPLLPSKIEQGCARLIVAEQNSLNNRWTMVANQVETPAVFVTDDDMLVRPAGISCMLEHWKRGRGSGRMIVGPFVRTEYTDGDGITRYLLDELLDGQSYSMVLPRAAVVSKDVLDLYAAVGHARVRDYVDTQAAHCDDIALNVLVANATRTAPLRVLLPAGTITDYDTKKEADRSGLGKQANRQQLREECLQWILGEYGRNPLKRSTDVGVCNMHSDELFVVDSSTLPREEYEKSTV